VPAFVETLKEIMYQNNAFSAWLCICAKLDIIIKLLHETDESRMKNRKYC